MLLTSPWLHPSSRLRGMWDASRASLHAAVFILKAFPMLPSKPIDWVTKPLIVEKLSYQTHAGVGTADIYRPSGGPHPGVVVSLGVVPLGVEHPQVARFGAALARAGFAVLLHWSPAMRDLRLDPDDIQDLVSAYRTLLEQPYTDTARSGLIGTCVGGAFALMAAAHPAIRRQVAFASAYAPYASMWTLVRDVASASRMIDATRDTWQVDPLTWKTCVRSLTATLEPGEAELLRTAFQTHPTWNTLHSAQLTVPDTRLLAVSRLSDDAQAVVRLLTVRDLNAATYALHALPVAFHTRLTTLSPVQYVGQIEAPLVIVLHDHYDPVIPVSESRDLCRAMAGRPGLHYTEMGMRHLDPTRLSPLRLAREIPKLYRAMYPMFRQAVAEALPT